MKRTITKLWTMIIVASMLLSMIPLGISAEPADECASLETVEEVPFEFELDPGDLPFEQLKEAVLEAKDIPACIDPALAEARGHVNRLYLQEPDDCSIMFQNRDGSKTVYLFSHPVKGMTMGTTATVQVNGTSISFTGTNAITSCIAELSDFNIGYAEVAYLPNGVLSVDGINLTEDARGWARCESTVSTPAYNISSEVAAEYTASITSPNTAVATAAAVPGVTITPIDPAPIGGMTVMAISYSDLAGVMSFRNESTNQFLTLTATSTPSLTTNSSITYKYSQWAVQYDSYFGYVVSNLSNVYNTYLGFDDMDNYIIDSLSYMMDTFTITIESTANSIVTIDCGQIAINSNGTLYEKSEDDDYFPTSCEWRILAKGTLRLATGINLPNNQTTRIVQSGVSFPFNYTFPSPAPTHYDLELYNASNNQLFAVDSKVYEDDEYWCTINTPGIHAVYYKDGISGVTSEKFVLIIVEDLNTYKNKDAYSITSAVTSNGSVPLYLTRNSSGNLILKAKDLRNTSVTRRGNTNGTIMYQDIEDFSRTFTFDYVVDSLNMDAGVYMTATRSTSQYSGMPQGLDVYNGNAIPDYTLSDPDVLDNTLSYSSSNLCLVPKDDGTPVYLCDMGDYFIILCDIYVNSNNEVVAKALKANGVGASVSVSTLTESDDFKWNVFFVGIDVPVIKQTDDEWCGPTSYLQTLYGINCQNNVPGDTLNAQQYYIRSIFYDYSYTDEATYMDYYALDINNSGFLPSGYICIEVNPTSSKTQQELRDYLIHSLQDGMGCIFFTVTGKGPYKNGYDTNNPNNPSGHLECVIGYDYLTDTVIINNCHFMESRIGLGEIRLSDLCIDMERLWYFDDIND